MTFQHSLHIVEPGTPGAKRIIFARHGQYVCNVHHTVNCDPSIPHFLTPLGVEQADALGQRLKNEGVELIISSQFPRARHTAERVNRVLKVPMTVNALANENRVGRALEGRSATEYFATIAHDPVDAFNEDGGESFRAMGHRIIALADDIANGTTQTTLVTTHGWALQIIRVLLGETSLEDAPLNNDMPTNCETRELWVMPSRPQPPL